jgi:sugar (pentulose or hexulose) kinase
MKDYFLVIDVGTQSLRASVVSSTGDILAFSRRKYEVPYFSPEKGFAEQRVDFYLEEIIKATNDIYDDYPDYLKAVKGLVIDVFRDSSIILDEEKKPLRNAVLWLDQRITRIPGMKNLKWYEKIIFKAIGMMDTVKYNAERTVSYWLMEHEPELWKKMKYYCPLGAYFNYKITGNLAVSTADCIGHYPIDFKSGKWLPSWHPKQSVFSIPVSALPPLVPVGQIIGNVTEEFSRLSKIPAGLPVYASGSDKACETYGNGCTNRYSASISLGTACTIEVVSEKYSEPEKFLPSYQTPYPGAYDLEVQVYSGLWMIKWFVDNFGSEDKEEAQRRGISVEQVLNEKIRDIPAGCDGLVLQPYWQPGLKRPNGKGGIIGFSNVHGKYHIYRAIYEGIAFALREGMDEIVKKTHITPAYLVISGGGSNSPELCHIIADVFGIPCTISNEVESSTIGGAMSGFLNSGVFKTPQEAKDAMVTPGQVIEPDSVNHKIYNQLYTKVYLKMYPGLAKAYENNKNFYLDVQKYQKKS